jgi:agmatinase
MATQPTEAPRRESTPTGERDPDGPPSAESGLFGLDDAFDSAHAVVVQVPFEATVSYGAGTKHGPEAIRRASHQVDLLDADVGDLRAFGICTLPPLEGVAALSDDARNAAVRVIDAQIEGVAPDVADIAQVDRAALVVERAVHAATKRVLDAEKVPFVVGGDHSVPLGAIVAAATRHREMGILHIDAHADLRLAYEGFSQSHASIMRNVKMALPDIRITQVAIRDFSREEVAFIDGDVRIVTFFDRHLRNARLDGQFRSLARAIVETLPATVWISFDIDGLDPTLCPSTGTPVPGGLSFDEWVAIMDALVASGRKIVGADIVEVSPGDAGVEGDSWDAVVGARLLYKLIGYAAMSQQKSAPALLPDPHARGPRG